MHKIQQKILNLSKDENIWKLSLRSIASRIWETCSPQKIKHHLEMLKKKWLIKVDKINWTIEKVKAWISKWSNLISIPILGSANCWEAVVFADWQSEWFLQISQKMINSNTPSKLYALKAVWNSMNKCSAWSKLRSIDEWDYVIVDSRSFNPKNWDIVVSIIDNCANIKKIIIDKENGQIVLASQSTFDIPPIFISEQEYSNFLINWKVVEVIKKPKEY